MSKWIAEFDLEDGDTMPEHMDLEYRGARIDFHCRPKEPQKFKWCTDCREYDQEKHCCHRWSKVIRDTVEEMKQEQEPILDKLRAEIEDLDRFYDNDYFSGNRDSMFKCNEVMDILDKYKVETEADNGNVDK